MLPAGTIEVGIAGGYSPAFNYVEGGAGALGGRAGPRTGNCDINFVL
jgi:hypothetical protein